MNPLSPVEQAVVQFALNEELLTREQVDAARRAAASGNADVLAVLRDRIKAEHLPAFSAAFRKAFVEHRGPGNEAPTVAGTFAPPPSTNVTVAPPARTLAPPTKPAGTSGKKLGRYEVERELARGGMGVVYVARDTEMADRRVALKQMLAGSIDPGHVERFKREAQALALLQHPNIVHVYEVGQEEGAWFLAMDLIDGESLQDRLKRDGPFPPLEAARLTLLLAQALAIGSERAAHGMQRKPARACG